MMFEWRQIGTPEAILGRREAHKRREASLETLAYGYSKQADEVIRGADGAAVSEEIAGFSKQILEAREGSEQEYYLERLLRLLELRKPGAFKYIEENNTREKLAFTLALVGSYRRSLQ